MGNLLIAGAANVDIVATINTLGSNKNHRGEFTLVQEDVV